LPYMRCVHQIQRVRTVPLDDAKKYLRQGHAIDYYEFHTITKRAFLSPLISSTATVVDDVSGRYIRLMHEVQMWWSQCSILARSSPLLIQMGGYPSDDARHDVRCIQSLDRNSLVPMGLQKRVLRLGQPLDSLWLEDDSPDVVRLKVVTALLSTRRMDPRVLMVHPPLVCESDGVVGITDDVSRIAVTPDIGYWNTLVEPTGVSIRPVMMTSTSRNTYIDMSVMVTFLTEHTNSFVETEYVREFILSSVYDSPMVESTGENAIALSDVLAAADVTTDQGEPVIFRLLNHILTLDDTIVTSETTVTNDVFDETVIVSDRVYLQSLDTTPKYTIDGTVWSVGDEEVTAGTTVHIIRKYSHLLVPEFAPVSDAVEVHHYQVPVSIKVCDKWWQDVVSQGEVVTLGTFEVTRDERVRVFLSTTPDEITDPDAVPMVDVDDQLIVTTKNGSLEFGYWAGDQFVCEITSIMDIGTTSVTVQVKDIHGVEIGSSDLYIIGVGREEIRYDETVYDGGSVPTGKESLPVESSGASSIYPTGNMPDYITSTDEFGYYTIPNLTSGVYALVALKPGYSAGFAEVNVTEDVSDIGITMVPLQCGNNIERIYNHFGHIFKVYRTRDEISSDVRIVEYTVLFGDLFGTSASIWNIHEDGYIRVDASDPNGTLQIIDLPFLDRFGTLEATVEKMVVSDDRREISWHNVASIGDFMGFKFRYTCPKDTSGFLDFSITTPIGFMVFSDDTSTIANINEVYQGRVQTWDQMFPVALSDGFGFGDDIGIVTTTPSNRIHLLTVEDICPIRSDFMVPQGIKIYGILVSDTGLRRLGCPVVLLKSGTREIVAITMTNSRGEWHFDNIRPGRTYDMYASDVSHACLPVNATFTTSVKDIAEPRVTVAAESESFRGGHAERYLDVMDILPSMSVNTVEGRLYGHIYNDATHEMIESALIRVYKGHLTADEIVAYTGTVYTTISGVTPGENGGYYLVYTDIGDLTVVVDAPGYMEFEPLHITIGGGCRLDIGLHYIVLSGNVYRALEASYGKMVPIEGAMVTVGGMTTTTDEAGYYDFTAYHPSVIQGDVVMVRAIGYKPVEKKLPMQMENPVKNYTLRLWRQPAYGGLGA
jgi:hypothetical protein